MIDKEKYKNHRVIVLGTGRGNPFNAHYGMEQTLDKIGAKFIAWDSGKLERDIVDYSPTHIIIYANIGLDAAKTVGRIRKIKRGQNLFPRDKRILKKKGLPIPRIVIPKIGWWFWDLRTIERHKSYQGWIDKVFLCNKEYMEMWHKELHVPVYYMPQCATENVLYKDVKVDKVDWDIFFMGSLGNKSVHGNRGEILEFLKAHYKLKAINGFHREDRIMLHHQSSYYYEHSPFCLDVSANAKGYTSNRPYEILANHGFLLIKYFDGIEDIFENHKHCVWFKTIDEMAKVIDYYIDKPKERKKIAEVGHKLFLEKHTFDCRLDNILDIMDGKTKDYYGYKN